MLKPYRRAGVLALAAALTSGFVVTLSAAAGAENAAAGQRIQKFSPDIRSCVGLRDEPGRECFDDVTITRSCVTPGGTDINQLHGIKERIIGPPACLKAFAKERWVQVTAPWITAKNPHKAVYPKGYKPERAHPIDDFNAKFVYARYVIDIDTPRERSFTFGKNAVLRSGLHTRKGFPYSVTISPSFKPERVGRHTTLVYFKLREEHCDGLGTDRVVNCLPAGEFIFHPETPFEVIRRRR